MGKHKGQAKKDWAEAVKSAAETAPVGNYTLTTEETFQQPKGGGSTDAPIREYIVTLEN